MLKCCCKFENNGQQWNQLGFSEHHGIKTCQLKEWTLTEDRSVASTESGSGGDVNFEMRHNSPLLFVNT